MIIGNGMVASAFKKTFFEKDANIILFASGVSNSREVLSEAFLREKNLLLDALSLGKFIYLVSSCSVNDQEVENIPYFLHKKEMESLVISSKDYAIFRLPQVVGRSANKNTLTNFLYYKIISGLPFNLWRHAKRNLIDIDDVSKIACYLARKSLTKGIVNIASPLDISMSSLVNIFESVLDKQASYKLIDAGNYFPIDSRLSIEAANQLGVNFDEHYIKNLIIKYYG